MIDAKNLFLFLKKNKINFFTGVPDSVLKNFIYILDFNKKKTKHIIATNEGSAVALAAGNYLATKKTSISLYAKFWTRKCYKSSNFYLSF